MASPNPEWTEEDFLKALRSKSPLTVMAAEILLHACRCLNLDVSPGRAKTPSMNMKCVALGFRDPFLSLESDGRLGIEFPWLRRTELIMRFRDHFKDILENRCQLPFPADYESKWLRFESSVWRDKVGRIFDALAEAMQDYRHELDLSRR